MLAQDADPRRLVETVLRAQDAGRPVAVVDARWPAAVQVAAWRRARSARLAPADLLVFTSGSTRGWPRGVHRTRDSWLASADALTDVLGLSGADVVWLPGHPASTAPLYAAWHTHLLGLPVRYGDEPHADATVVHAPPTLVPRLLASRAHGGLPRLRLIVTAGDRVPDDLPGRCERAGVRLIAYYGAAELSFVAVRDDDGPGYRAFPGVDLAIRDGLLWSRSAYQAHCYLAFAGDGENVAGPAPIRRDEAGWACVGDHARWLAPDRVEVLGRADQAVTVSGHTVIVEEVENVLRAVAGVAQIVVVGVADRVHGQRVVALWTSEAAATPRATDRALRAAAAGLPAPARPRNLLHMDELPLTPAGKPDRTDARLLAQHLLGPLEERPENRS